MQDQSVLRHLRLDSRNLRVAFVHPPPCQPSPADTCLTFERAFRFCKKSGNLRFVQTLMVRFVPCPLIPNLSLAFESSFVLKGGLLLPPCVVLSICPLIRVFFWDFCFAFESSSSLALHCCPGCHSGFQIERLGLAPVCYTPALTLERVLPLLYAPCPTPITANSNPLFRNPACAFAPWSRASTRLCAPMCFCLSPSASRTPRKTRCLATC